MRNAEDKSLFYAEWPIGARGVFAVETESVECDTLGKAALRALSKEGGFVRDRLGFRIADDQVRVARERELARMAMDDAILDAVAVKVLASGHLQLWPTHVTPRRQPLTRRQKIQRAWKALVAKLRQSR